MPTPAAVVPGTCFDLRGVQVRLGPAPRAPALDGVNLRIAEGERVAFIGANGSGKSTLLRTIHGLLPLTAGQCQRPEAPRMAMLFQRPHMLRVSALHNVALGLWLKGMPWRETKARSHEALARVGLSDIAPRNGRALSGGQQQRLALARAWALRPDVWLLDEPTASLDPHAKREVEELIAEFTAMPAGTSLNARPNTLVFASHNLGQVKRLASRVVYLEQGRVLADLPVRDFFNPDLLQALCPHAHLFVQGESW
jgi:tungstate transport system ATP-binding protein